MSNVDTELIEAIEKVEQLVTDTPAGPNDEAMRQIGEICSRLQQFSGADSYIRTKASSLRGRAETYFSVRKHKRTSGAERVRSLMLADCRRLRMAIRNERDGAEPAEETE